MDGDSVVVKLFHVAEDVDSCQTIHHEMNRIVLSEKTSLKQYNQTHGSFDVDATDLATDGRYCLTLDLVHPYCQPYSHEVLPKVCHIYLSTPLVAPAAHECTNHEPPVVQLRSKYTFKTFALYIFVGLIVIIAVVLLAILVYKQFDQRCQRDRAKLSETAKKSVVNGVVATDEERVLVQVEEPPEILFLYYPEDNPTFSIAVTALSQWLQALGCHVRDMASEEEQEEVAAHQEAWAQSIMANERNRAVVINSPAVASMAATSIRSEDPLAAVRNNAVTYLTRNFVGDYRRVLVVSFSNLPPRYISGENGGNNLTASWPLRHIVLPQHMSNLETELDCPVLAANKCLVSAAQESLIGAASAMA